MKFFFTFKKRISCILVDEEYTRLGICNFRGGPFQVINKVPAATVMACFSRALLLPTWGLCGTALMLPIPPLFSASDAAFEKKLLKCKS